MVRKNWNVLKGAIAMAFSLICGEHSLWYLFEKGSLLCSTGSISQ